MEFPREKIESANSKFVQVTRPRQELATLKVGSTTLVSFVGKSVMDRAFFAGGNGLYLGEDAERFPVGGTLVLGSNFGAAENYCDESGNLLRLDETSEPGTWAGLRERFTSEQLRNTFFTNAWPFLHSNSSTKRRSPSNIGTPEKWLKDRAVLRPCLDLFRKTLGEVNPSLIVALGKTPAAFLSHIFPETLLPWRECSTKAMDKIPYGAVSYGQFKTLCVAISHPSRATLNSSRRKEPYRGKIGEARLLSEAFARAASLTPPNGARNG